MTNRALLPFDPMRSRKTISPRKTGGDQTQTLDSSFDAHLNRFAVGDGTPVNQGPIAVPRPIETIYAPPSPDSIRSWVGNGHR